MTCKKHRHSSPESAAKCYAKRIGKRADERIKASGALRPTRYWLVWNEPPREVIGDVCSVFYFYEGVPAGKQRGYGE